MWICHPVPKLFAIRCQAEHYRGILGVAGVMKDGGAKACKKPKVTIFDIWFLAARRQYLFS